MAEGTKNKTPLELEEEIEKLGASINVYATDNTIVVSANCLVRNYEKTLALVEEMLLEPRWDKEEFDLAKTKIVNQLIRQKADPGALAGNAFLKLVYGEDHIYALNRMGTDASVNSITLDDLKEFYTLNFSPSEAAFLIAGDIQKEKVMNSLRSLSEKWNTKSVNFPEYSLPDPIDASQLYFVDVPDAKQSVIMIGYLSLARTDPNYYPSTVMNYKLGGSFNGNVNMVLREEKGYTYGARTYFSGREIPGPFVASASVKSSATAESVQIFKDLMEQYRNGISGDELQFTKNALIKSNALEFETLGALLGMLQNINMYNFPFDYVKNEEEIVRNITLDEIKVLAEKYIIPNQMFFVIAGDAATQLEPLKSIGFGDPILIKE
jgi:zinc protease